MSDHLIQRISRILEDDASFQENTAEKRAEEIIQQFQSVDRVDFSPTRYGVLHQEQGKSLISVFEKGHNFYPDLIIEQIAMEEGPYDV